MNVSDNQDVAAGEILAEIDPTDYQTRVQQTQAALGVAQARENSAAASLDLIKAQNAATLTQAQGAVEVAKGAVEQAQAGIDQAKAGEEQAQAGVEVAQATVRASQAQAQSAKADVAAAQAESTRRAEDLKRYEGLDARAVSQQVRDAARAAADSAAAQLSAAEKRQSASEEAVVQNQSRVAAALAQVKTAQAAIAQAVAALAQAKSRGAEAQGVLQAAQTGPQQQATSEAQVKTAQAAVEQAKADLQAAQQQLAYTKIFAPVSGRVTRKSVQPGQFVDAGRVLLSVVDPNVWVTANFKETQITRMHAGQSVDIRVDAYPGRTFEGRIESIQAGTGARFSLMPPENATGNFVKVVQRVPVKIVFDNQGSTGAAAAQLLGPGMSAVPKVRIAGNEGTPAPISVAPKPAPKFPDGG